MSTRTVGDYILNERIGRGSFAVVYKAKHKATQNTVAIKCIALNKIPSSHRHYIDMEIQVMRDIRHANLLSCNEFIRTDSRACLVVEYCPLGDLHDYHKASYGNLGMPEDVVLHFLSQLASAIKYLHGRNLIHRDIKPKNILLVPPTNHNAATLPPTVKLADFGFARSLPKTSLASSVCGSPLYMAPEVLNRVAYDAKADLWSLGIVLYELMTGRVLFEVSNQLELCLQMRLYEDIVDFGTARYSFSDELKDLVRVLLKKKAHERASGEVLCYYVDLVVSKQEMQDTAEISVIESTELKEFNRYNQEAREDEFIVVDCDEETLTDEQGTITTKRRHSSASHQQKKKHQAHVPRLRTLSDGASMLTKAISSLSPMTLFARSDANKPSFLLSSSSSTMVDQTVYFEAKETASESASMNHLDSGLKQINGMLESIIAFADEKYKLFEKNPLDQVVIEESFCLTLKIRKILRLSIQKSKKQYEESLLSKNQDLDSKLEVVEAYIWMKNMLKLYSQRISHYPSITNTSCLVEILLYDRALDMSKEASVLQLVGEDLVKCIKKYTCSIDLLRAILIEPDKEALQNKDRDIIEKMVKRISQKIQLVEATMLKNQQKSSSSTSSLAEQVDNLRL